MNNAGPNPSRLDLSIRQALAMATDKVHINDQYYLGFGEPGTTLIPPVNDWHYEPTDDELYKYDLQAARDLLEASGYRVTENSPTAPTGEKIRVCTADSYAVQEGLVLEGKPLIYDMGLRQEYPEEKDIAMYLESEWAKIGVQINYKIMTEAALGAYVYAYACDTFLWYWSADVDPMYQLFCQSKVAWDGWNDNMYTSAAYEQNFSRSVQEFDEDLRREYVDNCQKVHYRDVSYIILSYVGQTYGWRTDTFSGWGDWDANPGRSVDNFWTGNPLYFDLEYIGGGEREIPWMAIAAGVGVIAAAAAAVVFLKKRGGGKKGEKKEEKTSPLGE
jgi:peptide/nickel transport system substrate-binding protein